jgi:VanZ family protein
MTGNNINQRAVTPRPGLWRTAFWGAALFALVMASLPHPPSLPGTPSDKIQHIIAFVTLTGLAAFAYPAARVSVIFLALAAFGGAIELVQAIPALHRDASLLDWLADVSAVGTALAAVAALRLLRARRRA